MFVFLQSGLFQRHQQPGIAVDLDAQLLLGGMGQRSAIAVHRTADIPALEQLAVPRPAKIFEGTALRVRDFSLRAGVTVACVLAC